MAWDTDLARRPVLLTLLGSDVHMMERLTDYDRPFHGRADPMVLGPLDPAETGKALRLPPADAVDAHLVSGGLPGILRWWPAGTPALAAMEAAAQDPASPLFTVPAMALMAEFADAGNVGRVLEAIGGGDRTQANIAAKAANGPTPLASGVVSPILRRLTEDKGVLAADTPLSTRPGKPSLHRCADTNLRCYQAILRDMRNRAGAGEPELAVRVLHRRWTSWRERAVKPLIRAALRRAALRERLPWPDVEAVGGWWNRRFDPEIDLVGADRAPVATRIHFAGSVKWIGKPFDAHDLHELKRAAPAVPGFDPASTGLAVVSLSGVDPALDTDAVDLIWGPEDVIAAWE